MVLGTQGKVLTAYTYTASALLLSTTTLQVDGTLNLKEQSSEPSNPSVGDLAFINDDLYIAKQ